MKLEEVLHLSDHLEGLAFVLYDSMANGLGETDRKLSNASSLLLDVAVEVREHLNELVNEVHILKKGEDAA